VKGGGKRDDAHINSRISVLYQDVSGKGNRGGEEEEERRRRRRLWCS